MVLWGHVEVAGLWRVVGGLFGYVVALGFIWKFPKTGVDLAENRIKRFLHATVCISNALLHDPNICLRWFNVPSTEVEFYH